MAFPYLVKTYLPIGLKGIVLCGLFASLMSTVDSTFNSLATLWSVDVYSTYINKEATDYQKIRSGRKAIIFSLFTALLMSMILLYLKFDDPDSAFTHTLNNLRYYINCGVVVLICSAVLLLNPLKKTILFAFVLTLPFNLLIQFFFPEMNYFLRAFWVIFSGLTIAILFNTNKLKNIFKLIYVSSKSNYILGWSLLISLILIHIIFH